jgi:hypothetical protein
MVVPTPIPTLAPIERELDVFLAAEVFVFPPEEMEGSGFEVEASDSGVVVAGLLLPESELLPVAVNV